MPFRPEHSLLRVEVPALHTIDTGAVENLFGMWSLFSKTSHAMEDGKRLENLSWRLWNRETFCCAPESRPQAQSVPSYHGVRTATSQQQQQQQQSDNSESVAMPTLSTSLDSISSLSSDDDCDATSANPGPKPPAAASRNSRVRPAIRRTESTESSRSRGREKHITSDDLQKIVISIRETKQLEPIDLPMATPASRAQQEPPATSPSQVLSKLDLSSSSRSNDTSSGSAPHPSESRATLLESSASTVNTSGSQASQSSETVGSPESSSTEMSAHSIVRGFVPGGVPSSYRSQTHLPTQPTPILKPSSQYRQPPPKKKGAMFTIGTSSGEEESSLESHMYRSQLSESLKRHGNFLGDSNNRKQTSFKDEIAVSRVPGHSPVFESDDEEEEVSESAIEDDDDSSDWEDSDDQSRSSSVNEKELFQRVDSRPNLTSRRSLLTTLMHEPERAKALQNTASRSSPALRRSRATTPNGPSMATSPEPNSPVPAPGQETMTRARPIIMTTSNTHEQLALSPRTTRRNMLSTELTESLRKNLLWERQHKSTGNLASLRRRHTSTDVKNLKQQPDPKPVLSNTTKQFSNEYFSAGLLDYHFKGW